MRQRARSGSSLLGQIFATSVVVLVGFAILLVVAPVRISESPVLAEAAVVAGCLVVVLAIMYLVLRRLLAPLRVLTTDVALLDPADPGRLADPAGGAPEIEALHAAFNDLLDRLDEERRQGVLRALAAQEGERARIAREMHDEVGQSLTAITLHAERLADLGEPVEPQQLRQLADTALRGLEDVRRLGRELRPEALDDLGLGNALITLCRRMGERGIVRIAPHVDAGVPPLSAEAELVVYRIAQEAITNALRHAQPTRIDVTLAAADGAVELVVVDNGRGLPEQLPRDTAGMSGMRERAELVGGELLVRSQPRRGTQIRLHLPREAAAP